MGTATLRQGLKISRSGAKPQPLGEITSCLQKAIVTAVPPITKAAELAAAAPATASADAAAPAGDAAVADIPDIPTNVPAIPTAAAPAEAEGPAWLWTLSTVVQAAACVAIGALAWFLYTNAQTQYF